MIDILNERINSPLLVVDEPVEITNPKGIFSLGKTKRAFLVDDSSVDFIIRSSPGGNKYTPGIDYSLNSDVLDTYYTTVTGHNIYWGAKSIKLSGIVYVTYKCIGSYNDATIIIDHENRLDTAEGKLVEHTAAIAEINTVNATQDSHLVTIDNSLQTINTEITQIQSDVTTAQSDIDTLQANALMRTANDYASISFETPDDNDLILFEDESDSYNKKKCTKYQITGTLNTDVTSLKARVTNLENSQGGSGAEGNCPVGTIIPIVTGFFSDGSNGAFTNVDITIDSCWQLCNGSEYNNVESPIYNAAGRHLPNLTDNRFLMGSTIAGNVGGSNTTTLTSANLPPHTHVITHTHTAHNHGVGNGAATDTVSSDHAHYDSGHAHAYGGPYQSGGTAGAQGTTNYTNRYGTTVSYANIGGMTANHTHGLAAYSNSYTGNSGDGGFANSAIENRPSYLTAKYFIRVY